MCAALSLPDARQESPNAMVLICSISSLVRYTLGQLLDT